MRELRIQKAALVFGLFLGGWHAFWSILIFTGFAQPFLNFVFWMHMIANPYHVTGFHLTQSIMLIAATFGFGYLMGWVFAWLWNHMHKE